MTKPVLIYFILALFATNIYAQVIPKAPDGKKPKPIASQPKTATRAEPAVHDHPANHEPTQGMNAKEAYMADIKVYDSPEEAAVYPGGEAAMIEYIQLRLSTYKIYGPVQFEMIIEKDGSVSEFIPLSITKNEELLAGMNAMLKDMPRWISAKNYHMPVRSSVQFIVSERGTVKVVNHEEKVFAMVDHVPVFPGGTEALMRFLGENIRYPEMARDKAKQGKVIISFIIEKDGSLTNYNIVSDDVGYGAAEESVRVLKLSPEWSPGTMNHKEVRVQYKLPVVFKLGE